MGSDPAFNPKLVHNRSPKLSALEVRDTFKHRMGWTDRETVALIGGGHTLGRTHGNCSLQGTRWAQWTSKPFNEEDPYFEAIPGSHRGPSDGTCGTGPEAGLVRTHCHLDSRAHGLAPLPNGTMITSKDCSTNNGHLRKVLSGMISGRYQAAKANMPTPCV